MLDGVAAGARVRILITPSSNLPCCVFWKLMWTGAPTVVQRRACVPWTRTGLMRSGVRTGRFSTALCQSASPHSPSPQPPAARRHPLRLTAGLNSEGTNSTKGVGTGQIQTRHPRTRRCRELAVAAQSNSPFQRRRPRPVAVAFPVELAVASPLCSVTLSNRGGGIHRFKLHLARKGGDVEACRKVPAVVRHQFHESIEELRSKKRKTQEQYAESYNACDDVEREFDEIERNEMQQQQKSRVPTPISRKGK
ncbi:hypothetical protein AHAS_Ahas15G0178500 [Arachis hypogaea]